MRSDRDLTDTLRRTKAEEEKSTGGWLLPVLGRIVFVGGTIISALDHANPRPGSCTLTAFEILGIALFIAGLSLYIFARLTLGRLFSETVRIKPKHVLITKGLYRIIRHPIYLGEILLYISIPVIFSSLYGLVIMLTIIPMLLFRIRYEEKVLSSKFGLEYVEYARKTKKLIPYIY